MIELLNEKIKELRTDAGLTQGELAQKLGIAKNTLCQYEKNKANPSLEIIILISKIFEVSVDFLLGLENDYGVKTPVAATKANDGYNEEEQQLVEDYRGLNAPGKKLVKDVIKNLQAGSRAATSTENKTDKADKRA